VQITFLIHTLIGLLGSPLSLCALLSHPQAPQSRLAIQLSIVVVVVAAAVVVPDRTNWRHWRVREQRSGG
jgi:membrane protein YdbS with pleckstrin-like domain